MEGINWGQLNFLEMGLIFPFTVLPNENCPHLQHLLGLDKYRAKNNYA